jgi:hypothetical protein
MEALRASMGRDVIAASPSDADGRAAVARLQLAVAGRIHSLQGSLMSGEVDAGALRSAAECFQPAHYADVVVERFLAGVCGYPRCAKPMAGPRKSRNTQEAVARAKAGPPSTDAHAPEHYCSDECHRASLFLCAQLSDTPPHMRLQARAASFWVQLAEDRDDEAPPARVQPRENGAATAAANGAGTGVAAASKAARPPEGGELASPAARSVAQVAVAPPSTAGSSSTSMVDSVVIVERQPPTSPRQQQLTSSGAANAVEGYSSRAGRPGDDEGRLRPFTMERSHARRSAPAPSSSARAQQLPQPIATPAASAAARLCPLTTATYLTWRQSATGGAGGGATLPQRWRPHPRRALRQPQPAWLHRLARAHCPLRRRLARGRIIHAPR